MRELIRDRVFLGLVAVLLMLILLEAVWAPHYNPVFPWHFVPGYAAAIGVAGCLFVVRLSKWLGSNLLQRTVDDD